MCNILPLSLIHIFTVNHNLVKSFYKRIFASSNTRTPEKKGRLQLEPSYFYETEVCYMKYLSRFKEHYTAIIRLGIPIVIGQLGIVIVGLADNITGSYTHLNFDVSTSHLKACLI